MADSIEQISNSKYKSDTLLHISLNFLIHRHTTYTRTAKTVTSQINKTVSGTHVDVYKRQA